jgi:hypothetical protein
VTTLSTPAAPHQRFWAKALVSLFIQSGYSYFKLRLVTAKHSPCVIDFKPKPLSSGVIPIMLLFSKKFLETKTENILELKEGFSRRIILGLILVLMGVIYFLITLYGKSSGNPKSDLIAKYFYF